MGRHFRRCPRVAVFLAIGLTVPQRVEIPNRPRIINHLEIIRGVVVVRVIRLELFSLRLELENWIWSVWRPENSNFISSDLFKFSQRKLFVYLFSFFSFFLFFSTIITSILYLAHRRRLNAISVYVNDVYVIFVLLLLGFQI